MRINIKTEGDRSRARRQEAISAALQDERLRLNAAIVDGGVVMIRTFSGSFAVNYVTTDWSYVCGTGRDQKLFCGYDDDEWADLLQQAGVPRNPLLASVQQAKHN